MKLMHNCQTNAQLSDVLTELDNVDANVQNLLSQIAPKEYYVTPHDVKFVSAT